MSHFRYKRSSILILVWRYPMRILMFHLSDLHLHDAASINTLMINDAIQSLAVFKPFEAMILILSGDIASAGNTNEYKIASRLIGSIVPKIQDIYGVTKKNTKVLVVPGNHDIDRTNRADLNDVDIRKMSEDEYDSFCLEELGHMSSYFKFSNDNRCFFSKCPPHEKHVQLVTRKILHFENGYRIEANLLNTAPFSCSSDDGLHHLPEEAISLLRRSSSADLSITVMHHAPEWFQHNQKKELQTIIAQRSAVLFYGHEHTIENQKITYDNGSQVIRQAGGAWYQNTSPKQSTFFAGVLDTDSLYYTCQKYSWEDSSLSYSPSAEQQYILCTKPLNGRSLLCSEPYMQELLCDKKYAISKDISDYFVFPDLRLSTQEEYSSSKNLRNMSDLISYIDSNPYIAIIGDCGSGKTMLLKMLFKELSSKRVVLYCNTDDITGRTQRNIIDELIRNTYGVEAASQFYRIPYTSRAIIIDDLHRIKSNHLDKFLTGLESIFGTIIVAAENTSQFDPVQLVKERIGNTKEFKRISIAHLYAEKRLEVITKIVTLKYNENGPSPRTVARDLEQYFNTYKLAFRTSIDFVVQYADYYCTHYNELAKADATVFSKVFESSIERAILPHLHARTENSGDIIVALSEVAHYIHFNEEYPISSEHICVAFTDYSDYYGNDYLQPARFLEIAEKSGLLVRVTSGLGYRFASKNHLAYFVAKALNRKYYDTHDDTNLKTVVDYSCFGINGDILMFLTYISDNVGITRLLLSQAVSCVEDWYNFDFSSNTISYLQAIKKEDHESPENDQKKKDLSEQSKKEELQEQLIETTDIYDYDASEIDKIDNQLTRAVLQLRTISRSFSAFTSILPAKDKKSLISAMYNFPNIIFGKWAEIVDENFNDLIHELIIWQDSPEYSGKKLTEEELKLSFQRISTTLLINLYYTVASYGANNASIGYLESHEGVENSLNHIIQRLFFYERTDDYQAVIRDAEKIIDETTDGMVSNIVSTVLHHLIVNSERLSDGERRRMLNKYFSKSQSKILLERQIVQNRKDV